MQFIVASYKIATEMETTHGYSGEGIPLIGEVLDTVRSARGQLGTLSHVSEDLEGSVAGLRGWLEKVLQFFSYRRNVTVVAVSIIATAALLNYLRGWSYARLLRDRLAVLDPELSSRGSALNNFARDIVRARPR